MNNQKPIRRHSRLRRFQMNAGYYSVKGLRIPVGMTFVCLTVLAVVLTGLSGLIGVASWWDLLRGVAYNDNLSRTVGEVMSVLFLIFLAGDYILYRVIRAYIKLPKGHLLNPLPPAPNEILPDAEVLVRPSSVSDSDQKKTLLRPASSTNETDPQTLLRASNGTGEE